MTTVRSDLLFGNSDLITQENWKDYAENEMGCCSYLQGMNATLNAIEKLLDNSNSLTSLEKNLKVFIEERRQFAKFAEENLPTADL